MLVSSKALDAHLRSSVHGLKRSETEELRNKAIQDRFSFLYGGFPFLDFEADDINDVLTKIGNNDISFKANVIVSADKLREKKS